MAGAANRGVPNGKFWENLTRAFLLAAMALGGWNLKQTVALERQMASVTASRFTNEDGLSVWKAISDIREDMAKLPTETPPPWFVQRVDKLEAKMDKLTDTILRVRKRGD